MLNSWPIDAKCRLEVMQKPSYYLLTNFKCSLKVMQKSSYQVLAY